jgi:hypothetical protein
MARERRNYLGVIVDIWDLVRTARRRWMVTLPLLAVLLFFTYRMGAGIGAEYTGGASTILLGPSKQIERDPLTDVTKEIETNPFLGGPGTDELNRALAISIESDTMKRAFEAKGLSKEYSLTPDNRAPILVVAVTAETKAQAEGTVDAILAELTAELQQQQDSVAAPDNQRAQVKVLSDSAVVPDYGNRKRTWGVFGALSVVLSVAAAVAADALLKLIARRRKRPVRQSVASAPAPSSKRASEPLYAHWPVVGGQAVIVTGDPVTTGRKARKSATAGGVKIKTVEVTVPAPTPSTASRTDTLTATGNGNGKEHGTNGNGHGHVESDAPVANTAVAVVEPKVAAHTSIWPTARRGGAPQQETPPPVPGKPPRLRRRRPESPSAQ